MRCAKQQAFDAFDRGLRPSQVNLRGLKRTSLYRYYQMWKRHKPISTPTPASAISSTDQTSGPEERGVLERYEEFKRLQKLDTRRAEVLQRAETAKASLRETGEKYIGQGIQIDGWQRRQQLCEERQGWVVGEIDAARSEEDLTALEALLKTAHGDIEGLRNELRLKLDEQARLRHKQEVELSCNLLRRALEGPLFPAYVEKAVEGRLLVRDEREAAAVLQALCQWEVVHDTAGANPAGKKQVWDDFVKELGAGGWGFINRLRDDNDRLKRQMQEAWGPCFPHGWFGPLLPATHPGWVGMNWANHEGKDYSTSQDP